MLYIFKVEGAPFVKFGFTASCPWRRISTGFWSNVHTCMLQPARLAAFGACGPLRRWDANWSGCEGSHPSGCRGILAIGHAAAFDVLTQLPRASFASATEAWSASNGGPFGGEAPMLWRASLSLLEVWRDLPAGPSLAATLTEPLRLEGLVQPLWPWRAAKEFEETSEQMSILGHCIKTFVHTYRVHTEKENLLCLHCQHTLVTHVLCYELKFDFALTFQNNEFNQIMKMGLFCSSGITHSIRYFL